MVSYGGYLIPVFSMKRWLFWVYYSMFIGGSDRARESRG